eukprot:CAMPEP_0176167012 /NCGR_PEP_ID=MMETSP0120_2-20121206/85431_1 /TAXON_ID=160619 /ORGANISM="Kryptoperidinium foliaceum, Strain CCMP 1326" /LENGTH=45 /DNA_ID= /DNA_START= /DNA_END= /DNA_ORIENTATION=
MTSELDWQPYDEQAAINEDALRAQITPVNPSGDTSRPAKYFDRRL